MSSSPESSPAKWATQVVWRLRQSSLRWVMLVTVGAGVLSATALTYFGHATFLRKHHAQKVADEAERLSHLAVLALREALWQFSNEQAASIVDALFVHPDVLLVQINDHDDRVFLSREGATLSLRLIDRQVIQIDRAIVRDAARLGELRLVLSTEGYLRELEVLRGQYVAIALLSLVLAALVIAFALHWTMSRPIRALVAASQRIAQGDLVPAVPALHFAEFDSLARSLNATRESLIALFEQVHDRNRALEDVNRNLEERVHQRTLELEQAVADLRRSQEELLRSEKLATLGRVVATIAHELNTPIGNAKVIASSIESDLRALLAELDAERPRRSIVNAAVESSREGLDLFVRSIDRAAELIANFKQVAVDQTADHRRAFEATALTRDLMATLEPLARRSGCELIVECDGDAKCDSFPGSLCQVLTNLVVNAIVHGYPDPGQPGRGGPIFVTCKPDGPQHVVLTVRDQGRGMTADVLSRVFDPFFTTRMGQGGTGIGMSIVHQIVTKRLGGAISVRSELGQGCSVTVQLPRVAPH